MKQGLLRYHYKNLRVCLVGYHTLTGGIVVQYCTPKGTWGIIDKIGYFSLVPTERKIYFNSKKLGFWLNQGAAFGRTVRRLLSGFPSAQGASKALGGFLKKNKEG